MKDSKLIKVVTDAAVDKKSGKWKGRAGVLILGDGDIVQRFYSENIGNVTSNEGEYKALLIGTIVATNSVLKDTDKKNTRLELYTDSKLVFNQMLGNYRTKRATFVASQKEIKLACKGFGKTTMMWHRRNHDLAVLADFASKHPRRTKTIEQMYTGKNVSEVLEKVAQYLVKDDAKAERESA